jgi:hypothetical protein
VLLGLLGLNVRVLVNIRRTLASAAMMGSTKTESSFSSSSSDHLSLGTKWSSSDSGSDCLRFLVEITLRGSGVRRQHLQPLPQLLHRAQGCAWSMPRSSRDRAPRPPPRFLPLVFCFLAPLLLLGADGAELCEHLLHYARERYFILLLVLSLLRCGGEIAVETQPKATIPCASRGRCWSTWIGSY